jgi:acetamidase/formamidase
MSRSTAWKFHCYPADGTDAIPTSVPLIGARPAAVKPVLTINSGDIVTIETASHIDPTEVDQSGVVPPSVVPDYTRAIFREVTDRGPAPLILTGPIAVSGAQPGDVLEVRILAIELAVDYGFDRQRPYAGALPEEFPGFFQRIIKINRGAKTAEVAPGVVVPLDRPFFGTMGVARFCLHYRGILGNPSSPHSEHIL